MAHEVLASHCLCVPETQEVVHASAPNSAILQELAAGDPIGVTKLLREQVASALSRFSANKQKVINFDNFLYLQAVDSERMIGTTRDNLILQNVETQNSSIMLRRQLHIIIWSTEPIL